MTDCTTLPYNPANILLEAHDMQNLLKRFGINQPLKDINIYRRAFVNKSYCTRRNDNFINGNYKCPVDSLPLQEESNERLEFFGDAVLSLVTAKYMFDRYPKQNEGFLTTMRMKIVNGRMLAELAENIGLGRFVIISQQLEQNGGRTHKSILEDTLEALIGAIYLDFDVNGDGLRIAESWVVNMMEQMVDFVEIIQTNVNYKDKLVRFCQHNHQFIPEFETVVMKDRKSQGHKVIIRDNNKVIIAVGIQNTKKLAELEAAQKALQYYNIA
jgi:ribonuclease III